MSAKYQQFNLIEEVTRNDGSKYYEISNINQNGIAEMAADNGKICLLYTSPSPRD